MPLVFESRTSAWRNEFGKGMDIVKQSLAITFVFALLWAGLWFLRKRNNIRISLPGGRGGQGLIESRGKLALSAQHSIHVLRIGDRELVVAVYPSGVTMLCDLARSGAGEVRMAQES